MFTLYHTQQQQQQQQQQQFVRHKKYYYLITNSNCRFGGREISEMFFFRLGRFKNLSTQTNNWTMTDSSLTPDILLIFTAPIFERFEDWDEVERARKEERESEKGDELCQVITLVRKKIIRRSKCRLSASLKRRFARVARSGVRSFGRATAAKTNAPATLAPPTSKTANTSSRAERGGAGGTTRRFKTD